MISLTQTSSRKATQESMKTLIGKGEAKTSDNSLDSNQNLIKCRLSIVPNDKETAVVANQMSWFSVHRGLKNKNSYSA